MDAALLVRMNQTLRHRGPDDEGFYVDGNIGMAMRRLSVIDLVGGKQPVTNEDGTVAVTFNGEIYNFKQLRTELIQAGHRFATNSDTEVIVHAYEQWDDDALNHFNGMFAIALWDKRRERLLLARDRMGKKPLYWHHSQEGLLWGSEAKALLAVPWITWDAMRFTNRLVGPLARFRESMSDMKANNPVQRIHLRQGDFLIEMQDDFNDLLSALSERGAVKLKTADEATRSGK